MGPKTWICVKTRDSLILFGCYEARKEANHWTIYGSGERTGIVTNLILFWELSEVIFSLSHEEKPLHRPYKSFFSLRDYLR
jgi:predicted Fe-S protein YdhL (DUF1289 family)